MCLLLRVKIAHFGVCAKNISSRNSVCVKPLTLLRHTHYTRTMSAQTYITLQNGQELPRVGLGTWQAKEEEVKNAVTAALEAGYKLIDTAFTYYNEDVIGKVVKEWLESGKAKREEIFITTKLPHFGTRASDIPKYVNAQLEKVQLDYIDLYLIHHPFGYLPNNAGDAPLSANDGGWVLDLKTDHIAMWKALEEQVHAGKIKGIGLSNFNISQIEKIISEARIPPVVLQVELHAYFQQKELRDYCKNKGIAIVAFSPLGSPGAKEHFMKKYNYSPTKFPDVMGNPLICSIADKYKKTSAQILLRHMVQSNISVIPKSSNPMRIKQNIQIFDFELTSDEMDHLNSLDQGEGGRIFDFCYWKGVQNHPEYPFPRKGE